jgi:hypothetical protein
MLTHRLYHGIASQTNEHRLIEPILSNSANHAIFDLALEKIIMWEEDFRLFSMQKGSTGTCNEIFQIKLDTTPIFRD